MTVMMVRMVICIDYGDDENTCDLHQVAHNVMHSYITAAIIVYRGRNGDRKCAIFKNTISTYKM